MNWFFAEYQTAGTYHDLVEKVLDELLLERSGGKESVEVGAQKLRNEIARVESAGVAAQCREDVFFSSHDIHVFQRGNENVAQRNDLRTQSVSQSVSQSGKAMLRNFVKHYIFVSEMLEKLQLAISTLGKDGSAKRLHNLLDGDILVRELIAGGAVWRKRESVSEFGS